MTRPRDPFNPRDVLALSNAADGGRRCLFGSFVREPASARRASILPFDARGNGAPAGYLIILLPRRLRKPSRLEALFPIAPPSGTLADCVESGTERIPWAVSDTVCKNFATLNLYEFAAWHSAREALSAPKPLVRSFSTTDTRKTNPGAVWDVVGIDDGVVSGW